VFFNLKKTYVEFHGITGHLITLPLVFKAKKVGTYRLVTNIKHLSRKCGHKKLCNLELYVINAYKSP